MDNQALLEEKTDSTVRYLKCKKCGEEKSTDEFYSDSSYSSGYRTAQCMVCKRSIRNQQHSLTKQKLNAMKRDYSTCAYCKIAKPKSEFYRDTTYPCGYNIDHCRDCFADIDDKMIRYEMEETDNNHIADLLFENTLESLVKCISVIKDKIRNLERPDDESTYDDEAIDELVDDYEKGVYGIRDPEVIQDNVLDHHFHGYLYILREREFIKSQEHVYKIGRTNKSIPFDRMRNYPKNSSIIAIEKVFDPIGAEKLFISKLDALCASKVLTQREDIGREYYEGDVSIIRMTLQEVFTEK